MQIIAQSLRSFWLTTVKLPGPKEPAYRRYYLALPGLSRRLVIAKFQPTPVLPCCLKGWHAIR
ncbi:hypothetical protein D3C80_1148070 [compost metagenome]